MTRDENDVQEMADRALAAVNQREYRGLSYEEGVRDGVRDALNWVLDETLPSPLEGQ